jgi:Protein of unknown function (DUF2924)
MPGTELVRRYREKSVVVRVREHGFECDGQIHRSLSSAVRRATGTPWNGFAFFGQQTALILPPPAEDQVRVHASFARHAGHRHVRHQCLLHDSALLGDGIATALRRFG